MDPSGRQFQQAVKFEWKPEFCTECLKIGHDCLKRKTEQDGQPLKRRKPTKTVQTWVAKGVIQQQPTDSIRMADQQVDAGAKNTQIHKGKATAKDVEGEWLQPKSKENSPTKRRTEYQSTEGEKNERSGEQQETMANTEGVYAVSTKNGFQVIHMNEKQVGNVMPPDTRGGLNITQ